MTDLRPQTPLSELARVLQTGRTIEGRLYASCRIAVVGKRAYERRQCANSGRSPRRSERNRNPHAMARSIVATVLIPNPSKDFDPTEVAVSWKVLKRLGHSVAFATPAGRDGSVDDIIQTSQLRVASGGFAQNGGKRLSKNGGTLERAAQVAKQCEHAYDATLRSPLRSPTVRGNGVSRWSAAGSMTREAMLLPFRLTRRHRKHILLDQLRVRPGSDRNGIA